MIRSYDDQFDDDGVLRDGAVYRVPLSMRDGRPPLRADADTATGAYTGPAIFTDGRSNDPTAGCRPGWRIPIINDRRAVRDAYAEYENALKDAYRQQDGEDEDGDECEACGGYGVVNEDHSHADRRPLDQTIQDHRTQMNQLYADRDAELSQMWRSI
jgi:hypothetical protein